MTAKLAYLGRNDTDLSVAFAIDARRWNYTLHSLAQLDTVAYLARRISVGKALAFAKSRALAQAEAMETIRTSWAGYVITDPKQYPDVLSAMWKEVERMDKIARSALTEGASQ